MNSQSLSLLLVTIFMFALNVIKNILFLPIMKIGPSKRGPSGIRADCQTSGPNIINHREDHRSGIKQYSKQKYLFIYFPVPMKHIELNIILILYSLHLFSALFFLKLRLKRMMGFFGGATDPCSNGIKKNKYYLFRFLMKHIEFNIFLVYLLR